MGSSSNICHQLYAGSEPFSEPESSSIKNFILSTNSSKWISFVSIHSYGGFWLYNIDPLSAEFTQSKFINMVILIFCMLLEINYEKFFFDS
jgi:hypothetical protein